MAETAERQLLHTRQVTCTGYRRGDGLFDIEGRLLDTKADSYVLPFKTLAAGEPVHSMRLRLTVDLELVIRECVAFTDAGPTPVCHEINAAYAALVGLKIGPGFIKQATRHVGGLNGCTHLTELLGPMATTAFQALSAQLMAAERERARHEPGYRPSYAWAIGGCHAYRPEREVAQRILAWDPDAEGSPQPL